MPTTQEIIDMVDLEVRNTYTAAQKCAWLDMIHKQLYRRIRKDRDIVSSDIALIDDTIKYALPSGIDPADIKTVVRNYGVVDATIEDIPFKELSEEIGDDELCYNLIKGYIIFNALTNDDTSVTIFYLEGPTTITDQTLDDTPELPEDFHELLVVGLMERIARARRDAISKTNYANDYNMLLNDAEFMKLDSAPEYTAPRDVLPRVVRG